MRFIALYVVLALLLNIFTVIMPRFHTFLNARLTRFIVDISYPVTKGLEYAQAFINRYVILINVQQENRQLKEQLTKCEIYNNILKKQLHEKQKNTFRLIEAAFSFKGNFKTDTIFLHINQLDLAKKYCFVLSEKLSLVGIVDKKLQKGVYSAKTVFNPSFVADVFVLSNNKRFKALFIGNTYSPKVEFLDPNINIKKGDGVYTSGDFDIYPPGLYIGKVSSVKDINGYYKMAYVNVDRGFFNSWKVYILCKKK